jgi:hypothetical protein
MQDIQYFYIVIMMLNKLYVDCFVVFLADHETYDLIVN